LKQLAVALSIRDEQPKPLAVVFAMLASSPEKRFQLQNGAPPIYQTVRFARSNILIYAEALAELAASLRNFL
jgi:hypothetical protein